MYRTASQTNSRRSINAVSQGRYPITYAKKILQTKLLKIFNVKYSLKECEYLLKTEGFTGEWHHTSPVYNKTNYYNIRAVIRYLHTYSKPYKKTKVQQPGITRYRAHDILTSHDIASQRKTNIFNHITRTLLFLLSSDELNLYFGVNYDVHVWQSMKNTYIKQCQERHNIVAIANSNQFNKLFKQVAVKNEYDEIKKKNRDEYNKKLNEVRTFELQFNNNLLRLDANALNLHFNVNYSVNFWDTFKLRYERKQKAKAVITYINKFRNEEVCDDTHKIQYKIAYELYYNNMIVVDSSKLNLYFGIGYSKEIWRLIKKDYYVPS